MKIFSTYKKTATRALHLQISTPNSIHQPQAKMPALLMFHGGGWQGGSPAEMNAYDQYFLDQGYVTILVSYRLGELDSTTPFDAVDDAVDAYEYILDHATELGIDRQKIIIIGGSAGGHLAFWVARKKIHQSVSPLGLILLSAVVDTSPQGYGYQLLGDRFEEISPLHHIDSALPSTLIVHSLHDGVVPFVGVELFHQQLQKENIPCQLYTEGIADHGFYVLDPRLDLNRIDFVTAIEEFIAQLI